MAKIWVWITVVVFGVVVLLYSFGPSLFASIAYPLPPQYQKAVATSSEEFGISPNFLCGLIMVESGWKETARSHAGAVGMTQFMPSTAIAVAERLGISDFSPSDLTTDPELAIRFGAYYLNDVVRRNGGDKTLGLIAYNGGQGAVMAYQRGYPVSGTVGYVQKVLAIERVYDSIYGLWWKKVDFSATNPNTFTIQPKSPGELVGTISVRDFWKTLLNSAPASDGQKNLNNFWQNLLLTK